LSETKRGFIMNRTMTKNICLVAAFFITAILAVLMMGNNAGATASAASAEFEFVVREIEEPEDEIYLDADQIALLQEGDIAVDWYIYYSESVSEIAAGAVFEYDADNFDFIADGDEYLYAPGLGYAPAVAIDNETNKLSVGASRVASTTGGRFFTIYFRKISTSLTEVMPLVSLYVDKLNAKVNGTLEQIQIPVPCDCDVSFALLGDINGDGKVDSVDAMLLNQVLADAGSITETQWSTYSGRFPNVVCFAQVDANKDSIITSADSSEILDYYSHILLGTYDGPAGSYIVYYI